MAEYDAIMDVIIYTDTHSKINRTGLMKYYFPLLERFIGSETMSSLFVIDNTVPAEYTDVMQNTVNASQLEITI